MIWYYALIAIVSTIQAFFNVLSIPIITELPFGIDGYLVTTMEYVISVFNILPPFGVLFTAFMIYMAFEAGLLLLKIVRVIPE